MSHIRRMLLTYGSMLTLVSLSAAQTGAKTLTAPDSTLYTNYFGTPTSMTLVVCGSTQESEGCYGSASLGPFVGVGAMLEGNPSVSGDVVTRYIYVVDSEASPVTLYVYKKTDTVSASYDTISVTLYKTVSLSELVGGTSVTTYMAANTKYLYIGTSQSPDAVSITKSNLKVTKLSEFSTDVTSITSDAYGYVTLTQGDAFTVYDPEGGAVEDGGGSEFMLGTMQAVPGSSLLLGNDASVPRVHVRQKGTGGN